MPGDSQRFTQQWDAVDPFDRAYPHLWVKVEHLGRYLFAAKFLADLKPLTIADIGCGHGYGSRELARIAETVLAVDADDRLLESIDSFDCPTIQTVRNELGVEPLESKIGTSSANGIVCFETLEHLTDPESALAEFHQVLSSRGSLILSVPNSVGERIGEAGLLSNPFHQRLFSISSISELVGAAGFRVKHILGQPLASEINRNETRVIRRKQTTGRIGDEPSFHNPETIRRLALSIGYPEQRDVERSYSIIVVAEPT